MDTEAIRHLNDRSPAPRRSQRLAIRTASGALGTAMLGVAALIWMDARPPQSGHASVQLILPEHAAATPASKAARDTPGISAPLSAATLARTISELTEPVEPARSAGTDSMIAARASALEPPVKLRDRDQIRRLAQDRTQEGRTAAAAGRLQEARRKFEEAIDLDHGLADARYGLAIVLIRMGERESARMELDELRALDPSLANLLSNLLR